MAEGLLLHPEQPSRGRGLGRGCGRFGFTSRGGKPRPWALYMNLIHISGSSVLPSSKLQVNRDAHRGKGPPECSQPLRQSHVVPQVAHPAVHPDSPVGSQVPEGPQGQRTELPCPFPWLCSATWWDRCSQPSLAPCLRLCLFAGTSVGLWWVFKAGCGRIRFAFPRSCSAGWEDA